MTAETHLKENMHRILSILFMGITCIQAFAQNAPRTHLATVNATGPGVLEIPVTVQGFNNIGSIYLSVDYNFSVIQLTMAVPHPQLSTFLYGEADLGTGFHRITMGWYGNGLTLPDFSTIMTIHFNYITGNTDLSFHDNGPSCEYATGQGQVLNDTPFTSYYYNGMICGDLNNPGPITGETSVCKRQNTISYSVEPLVNASSYTWLVPPGVEIVAGQQTNLIVVDFLENAVSGEVSVYAANPCGIMSTAAILPVTVNGLPQAGISTVSPVPFGTAATLHGDAGGPGNFSFHWSPEALLLDPEVQNPQTVNLTAENIFHLMVTNLETGCQDDDHETVEITGGPLTVNPVSIADSICAGSQVMLFALCSGGTGNYSFTWTSDPSGLNSSEENPIIWPEMTTTCFLTASDGNETVSGNVVIFVEEIVIATISGTDTLCGDNGTTALSVELTGLPPWDFVYSFGSHSVLVAGQDQSPCNLITGDTGSYQISFVQNSRCEGTGDGLASVERYPVPPTPVIEVNENTLISDAGSGNQWYRNDAAIPGANGISFTPAESGKYYDIVTRLSCVSDTSNSIDIIIPGLDEMNDCNIIIYPNPAKDHITVRLSETLTGPVVFSLFSTDGRLCYASEQINQTKSGEISLNINNLEPGFYLLIIKLKNHQSTHKLSILNKH